MPAFVLIIKKSKIQLEHLKTSLTENLELSQFAFERSLKGNLAELKTVKQNADAVQLGRK